MDSEILKIEIEQWLNSYFQNKGTYNKKAYEAMSYSVNIGGKRIRPILMLLTYGLYHDNYKKIFPLAGAIEMIHTYSLIHDDLPSMDNDDLRRGKPTNHKVFGEAIAILAGDGLLNEAMSIMFKYCLNEDKNAVEACAFLSDCAGVEGMIGGQVVDILSSGKDISEDELLYMHSKKTGALIKAAILCGALAAGAPKTEIKILESFGEKLGLAFQIKDDVLDVIGDTELLGKKIKSDEANNKTNFVTTYGLEECKKKCITLTEECEELLDKLNMNTSELKKITLYLLKREF